MSESHMTTRAGAPEPERRPVRRKRRRKRGGWSRVWKVLGTMLLVLVTSGLLLACFAAVYVGAVIVPDARQWARDYAASGPSVSLTSTMYYTDSNGQSQPYLTIDSEENRVWVDYEDLAQTDLVDALIAIEDKRFYSHNGVDWLRTGRGVLNLFTGGSIQGGSTLTQQLIKNTTGENQVTVKRKITEIFRALELEKRLTKEQIIEDYLNQIYLGERCYGVGAASWVYFGKDVRELSLAQCASLVGITNNPSRYDPYLNKSAEVTNDQANRQRAKLILSEMLDQEKIDQAEYDAACAEVDALEFVRGSAEGTPSVIYNWYQDQVIDDVIADLREKFDWSGETASRKLFYGGLSIYTNVDLRIQNIVDEVYSDRSNLNYVSNSGQPLQSAIVITDSRGRVVALSGGIGEKTENRGWNRASDTVRPSGSSIKPLSVYAPAIEMGLITPYSVVDDAPYQNNNGSLWPQNAVGYYKGLDTVAHAVEQSTNTVAVRVLGDYVTPSASFDFLEQRFHLTSLVREQWIDDKKYTDLDLAPLALGGLTKGVSVYEMAAAYSTFPSMGRYVEPRTYSKVVDSDGTVLLDRTGDGEYVLKESTAYYMNNMLKGVVSSGTGTDAAFSGMTIAGKTGTTTAQKDLWFVGYTPYYTAAVWVGYDRQERLGSIGHPQNLLWKKVMSRVHEGLENKDFSQPEGVEVVAASYCLDSGLAPTALCAADARGSRVATGYFIKGDEPTKACDRHTSVTVCTADPILNGETGERTGRYRLAGERCPADTVREVGVLNYYREGAAAMAGTSDGGALLSSYRNAETCRVHTEGWTPETEGDFDPDDPATWPVDDPDFDIHDPATWPLDGPTVDDPAGEGTEPPAPSGTAHPQSGTETPSPEPTTAGPPSNEPFIPAGIPTE